MRFCRCGETFTDGTIKFCQKCRSMTQYVATTRVQMDGQRTTQAVPKVESVRPKLPAERIVSVVPEKQIALVRETKG